MKLKHQDLQINPQNPFENCKLRRQPYAEVLTNIIAKYADGFVLAINNEWGTGKTTFVKMWQQHLTNQGYKTLYFNAWENDFENGALAALMAELSSLKENQTEELFKKVLKTGAKLAKGAIPVLIKAAAAKYLDKEVLKELFEGVTDNANELLREQIEDYTSKKEGLKEFKKSLEEFVKKTSEEKPIVFIVDELDRCRPDYAVDVLEKVKHFFDVPGIVFVLSIDKEQLAHAIRGIYGSDNINADEYLRRFIDIEYVLPEPSAEAFCSYLFEYFDFQKFFNSSKRLKINQFREDGELFLKIAIVLFRAGRLTLRQQEKILVHSRVALNSFSDNHYVFPSLFIILIYLKTFYLDIYISIKEKKYSIQDLINEFETVMPLSFLDKETSLKLAVSEAQLLFFYNNMFDYNNREKLVIQKDNVEISTAFNSKLNGINDNIFERLFIYYGNNFDINNASLSIFIDRVDLINPIIQI